MLPYLFIMTLFIHGCISAKSDRDANILPTVTHQKATKINTKQTLRRMAFGSCNDQNKAPAPWQTIVKKKPQLWLWLGDSIYTDKASPQSIRDAYQAQLQSPDYQKFRNKTPVIGIWDDHDYAYNNAGKEVPYKTTSQKLFLDFLGEPQKSRRRQTEGIYTSYEIGASADKTIKIILLDTRYHADHKELNGDLLGKHQWLWLQQELTSSKAQFHVIASGIQILPTQHRFEKWANFPKEREKLIALLKKTRPSGLILLSGDRHIAEISRLRLQEDKLVITEITSSGLTHSYRAFTQEDNDLRVGNVMSGINYGWIDFDWHSQPALAHIKILDQHGQPKLDVSVRSNGDR